MIEKYGLLAIFLGAGIEGETVVFLGGILSHRQLLPFWPTALAATLGSFAADQLFFLAGRHARSYPAVRRVLARPTISSVSHLLERHPTGFVFAFRFIYGMRTVSPVAIGASQIPAAKFVLLNAVAALLWGPLFTALGYFAGQGFEQLLGRLPLPHHLFVAVAAFVCVIALAVVFRKQLMKLAARI
nr:DedA family protein [Rhizobium sp. ARZ01]